MNKLYRHHKGGIYKLICTAFNEATGEEKAVYQSMETAEIWERPFNEFVEKFKETDIDMLEIGTVLQDIGSNVTFIVTSVEADVAIDVFNIYSSYTAEFMRVRILKRVVGGVVLQDIDTNHQYEMKEIKS